MSPRFLVGARVLVDGAWLEGVGVLVARGRVAAVLPAGASGAAERVVLPGDSLLAPGLIDVQVNGGGGVLFNDAPDAAGALAIAAAHRRLGTTAILPTLITDAPDKMVLAAVAVRQARGVEGGGVLGVHFEGPFLSRLRPGVHDAALMRAPDEADLALVCGLAAAGVRVVLTLAPEMVADADLARLHAAGVILSAGHSAASYERVVAAADSGLRGFTHVFNAMPAPSARDPGVVGAALSLAACFCGVIVDGVHVHPAMLHLLLGARGVGRTMLVSDAMSPAGTDLARFELQGREIFRRGGRLETADGVLAGADLCLAEAVRHSVRLLGVTPAEALGMASAVPAAFLGLEGELGRIAPGYRADFVLLTEGLEVLGTWVSGVWQGVAA